jgi:ankyrin repeat protein
MMALHVASLRGHVDVVRCLLERKADIDRLDGPNGVGSTTLANAAVEGHVDVVKLLLQVE